MKHFRLFIFLNFIVYFFAAQDQRKIDSLKNELRKYERVKSGRKENSFSVGDSAKVKILYNLSRAFWSSDFDKAKEYANQTLALANKINYKKGIIYGESSLGIISWYKGDYPEALIHLQKGLKVSEEIKDKHGLAGAYGNIGIIYDEIGNYEESLKNHFASLKLDKELGEKNGVANSYINIGIIYKKQRKYPEALEMYMEGLKLFEEIGYTYGLAGTYGNIANIYELQKKYDEALSYNLKGLKIAEEKGDREMVANLFSSMGVVYSKKKDLKKAIEFENKALALAGELGALERINNAHRNLSEFYAEKGDFRQAYDHAVLYKTISDSIFNEENARKTVQTQMQYEFDKKSAADSIKNWEQQKVKDAQLAAQNATLKQNKFQRYFLLVSLALVLSVLLFVASRLYTVVKTRRILDQKNKQIESEKRNAEEQRLTAELFDVRNKISQDLHDEVGSALSSIVIYNEVARKIASEKTPAILGILSNMDESARTAMENMGDIVWAINPENDKFADIVKRIKVFATQLLSAKNILLEFETKGNIDGLKLNMLQRKNLYLIFKEAINNSAKYSSARTCNIIISVTDNDIYIRIADDGVGFDKEKESLGGNGLINMKARAEGLKGSFTIMSELKKGTVIVLQFTV